MSDLGNKQIMAKNIRYYMNKHSVSQTEICNTLGIKMPTFSDWVNAKTYPRIDKIELMANYFGISKADLVEEISEELSKTGEFFGLQIHGNSMEPKFSEGDVVIVRKQEDAESGDIVIATVNGTDATCKRLRKYRDGIELISTNPSYEPMFFSAEEIEQKPVRIIGRVVELRAKF